MTYDARFDHHSPEYDPSCLDGIEPDEPDESDFDLPNYWSSEQEPASADNPNEDDEADFTGPDHDNNGNLYPDNDR